MITIKGVLERITYQNPENHYTIGRLRIDRITDSVTIVGYIAGVKLGENLKLEGKWTSHPKYGDQFKVEAYDVMLPDTVAGIRTYLGSGFIKGVGKSLANKIVDHFGELTLDIIENSPKKLLQVHGIGKAKKEVIEKAWNEHHSVRMLMQFLQSHNVSVFHASTILKTYGSQSLNILKKEPYLIAKDIPKSGFQIADAIALKSGFEKDHVERIKAYLVCSLLSFEDEGHVYAFRPELESRCSMNLNIEKEKVENALLELEKDKEIVLEEEETFSKVYLKRLYMAEKGIANRIKAILSLPVLDRKIKKKELIELILQNLAVKLSSEQLDVVLQLLKQRVVVITGGPGTGKTTLIRALCILFNNFNQKIKLAAPTGRAARRLSEVTGKKAFTLHKLLGFDQENNTFVKNLVNPLDADVFVVDEASMVDTMLMYHLIQAVPVSSVLILVGDTFQLPSVGPGNVLADIIDSKAVKTFFLTKIFRQAKQSPIIMNAHSIRNGMMPDFQKKEKDTLSEFYFIENTAPQRAVETILELCSSRIKNAFSHIDEVQVLTPMHKGETGTINLNQQLQKVLNKNPGGIEASGFTFKTGDKVMHLKNNYEKDVFNGDIGIVNEVINAESRLTVDYDGRLVDYDILELDELTLAYTISVHKSQGSEYPAVIIALTLNHYPLLQRNLLYTAMTRGKSLVIIVGSKKALEVALNNNKTSLRLSGLKQKLET